MALNYTQGHKHTIIRRTKAQALYSTRTSSKCHTGTQAYNDIGVTLRLVHKPYHNLRSYVLTRTKLSFKLYIDLML